MKRYLLLALLLAGCSSTPTAPELPLAQVQRGPLEGDPEAPRIRKLTAVLLGDSLYLTALLVPTADPLPSYADWTLQAWVGTHSLEPGMVTSAEFVVVARMLEDIGPLARTIRRTNYPNVPGWGSCREAAWCDSVGVARVKTLNARKVTLVIPRSALDNARGPVACWLTFFSHDYFQNSWTMTGTSALARTEN